MAKDVIEIPVSVLSSIETLDELQDWLTAHNPQVVAELRAARQEDLAGRFRVWEPRHVTWPYRVEVGSRADNPAQGS